MSSIHSDRIEKLRALMRSEGIEYYVIPSADYHNSEYVAEFFRAREYFSGFTGSAGTLVVGLSEAYLWTDGRYFIQAAAELEGSGIGLMKMGEPGVPAVSACLEEKMKEGAVIGFDGRCVPCGKGRELGKKAKKYGTKLKTDLDLAGQVWEDRPAMPCHPVMLLSEEHTGETFESKVSRLREKMAEKGAAVYIESKLDCIMWLLNMRGSDVECNPVSLCHMLVDDRNVYLFIQEEEITGELRAYAALNRISLLPYDDFEEFLLICDYQGNLLYDPSFVSYSAYLAAKKGVKRASKRAAKKLSKGASGKKTHKDAAEKDGVKYRLVKADNPLEAFKCVKNPVEMANLRECYKKDSAALCRFIMWVTERVSDKEKEPVTESGAAAYLDGLRAELPDFMGLSFETISAYGANAAMMHYTAVPGISDAALKPEGMLLVDSGGQYLTGTTDVTRTIALGTVTEEMKKHYTLTAVSNLQLMGAVFLHGCTGINLDILAREPMWREGLDYKCGTGHGIGYFLSVHESPPSIRWRVFPGRQDTPFEPGMIVSDEPGVYLEGQYGIRIETILEVVDRTSNESGRFLSFEPLTLVPLDRKLIDARYLTPETRALLNEYHQRVRAELMPLLTNIKEQAWLIEQTEPV